MDNIKTGSLIKELRKEKGLTQKQLADLLHITDRAVSKWERGLCAPDISLLEPLAKILDVSLLELIEGERRAQLEHTQELDERAKAVINYSKEEIAHKIKITKKRYASIIAVSMILVLLVGSLGLWQIGYFHIIDKNISPDGNNSITVYDKNFSDSVIREFSRENATSIIMKYKGDKNRSLRVSYGDCVYQGIWWAPDSKKYVLALKYDDGVYLALNWLERNAESNLSAYLSMGVEMTELSKYGYSSKDVFPKIEYQFLQWALDSESMLIYYSFEDKVNEIHDGYFWFNCVHGTVSAVLELDS